MYYTRKILSQILFVSMCAQWFGLCLFKIHLLLNRPFRCISAKLTLKARNVTRYTLFHTAYVSIPLVCVWFAFKQHVVRSMIVDCGGYDNKIRIGKKLSIECHIERVPFQKLDSRPCCLNVLDFGPFFKPK